jgi:lipoprotein-anchoring transpeptidase ErfK/SrfK
MKDCARRVCARHSPFTKPQTFAVNRKRAFSTISSEYVMQRTLISLFLLVLAAAIAPAQAGPRIVMSGDPAIDAQWDVHLASSENPYGSRPVDPNAVESTGIFRLFGGGNSRRPAARAQPRAQIQAPAPAPRVRARSMDRRFLPRTVDYPTSERPGTIVIDTGQHFLYRVLEGGKAERYGVGVGREGFGWSGRVHVGRKSEWPTWTPPAEMRKRQPYLPASMPGGPENPLGARALYLYDGGRDTLYRIHGSNAPWTIGLNVSSGCIRMRNEDVIELYNKVSVGTRVVVF